MLLLRGSLPDEGGMQNRPLSIVSSEAAASVVTHGDAIALMRTVFSSLESGASLLFPATRGHGSDPGTRFGVKPGYDGARNVPGLKIGSYWPGNVARGLPNHGSTTILLDDATGFPTAIVEATWLNALRTAASDAVGVDALARQDAKTLAVIGTGNQAYHEVRAIALVRALADVMIIGRDAAKAQALVDRLRADGLPARVADTATALPAADIVVTVTTSKAPLFDAGLIRPGTHISAMGADGPGKQELPPALAERAELFADVLDQTLTIGEFQYLKGTSHAARIVAIGAVLSGSGGRSGPNAITVYDSSGIGLQDLAIAAFALDAARSAGLVQEVLF
jgi:ornithine cyclodeaminase